MPQRTANSTLIEKKIASQPALARLAYERLLLRCYRSLQGDESRLQKLWLPV